MNAQVDVIAGRLSLRSPQRRSLEILENLNYEHPNTIIVRDNLEAVLKEMEERVE